MSEVVIIDGASGGGQVLRNAVALSAVTGRAIRVTNVRGSRPKPGLRPQHLAALRAAADLCRAHLDGAEISSRQIEFHPGEFPSGGARRLDVGTAGSLTLVLQCLLPALAQATSESELTLTGGTDVPFSPPFDYFERVLLPALRGMGVPVASELVARGFYPKGGGQAKVQMRPARAITPIAWLERGGIERITGRSFSLGLPDHIARRMQEAACARLQRAGYGETAIEIEVVARGRSEGCGIALEAMCETGARLGGNALGRRGKRAEEVGEEAAEMLLAEIEPGAAVDSHLADQLVVWMARAEGPSEFTTARVTDHLRAAASVAEAMTGARFFLDEGKPVRVRCRPEASGG